MAVVLWRLGLKRCRDCGEFKPRGEFHRRRDAKDGLRSCCGSCCCKQHRRWLQALNMEMLRAYGNECQGCGEKDPNALTLDHIFNDGAEERRKFSRATRPDNIKIMIKLRKLGWPRDRHQLLCASCQLRKLRHAPLPNQWDGICRGINIKQALSMANTTSIINSILNPN